MKKMYDQTHACPECRGRKIIQEGGSGEIVCKDCGLVISETAVDTGPEWRAYSLMESENRTRIGSPIRFSLPDIGLSTTFRPLGADAYGRRTNEKTRFEMYRLKRWNEISNNTTHGRNLSWAMRELDKLCYKLNLPKMVKEEAAIMYRKALKKGLAQGRKISSLIAASLYTVCRMNQIPRTLDEISHHSPIDKKEIAQYYRLLLKEMNLRMPVPKAEYGVSRIASGAGLSEITQRNAIEILGEAERLRITIGKSPMGMAGAALYLASTMNGEIRTKKVLAEASGVTEATIRNHYNVLKEILTKDISNEFTGVKKMKGKATSKERLILEATPRDKWVMANEIADNTGLASQAVGSIIGYNLLQYIERKKFTDSSNRIFLYKRIS